MERDEISETGNWNVAADYARSKIMEPLKLADYYELIAKFGAADFIDELNLNIHPDVLKIKGFQRLVDCLLLLINNSLFAVKIGKDDLKNYKEELERVDKLIPTLYTTKTNNIKKTSVIVLIPKNYDKVLERVKKLKALINEPLNKNHLIFTNKKEFDPKVFKDAIRKRVTTRG